MTKGTSQEVSSGKEFYAWAGELTPRNSTISATMTAGDLVATVVSSDGIRKYDVLWFPSENGLGEHVRVTAIATLDVTVQRISTTPASVAATAAFFNLGEATDELESTSAEDNYMAPAKVINRIQTLRRAWSLSVTEMATATRMAVSFASFKADQARDDFTKDIAHTFWFAATNVVSTTVVTSKGINEQLVGNGSTFKINAGGALAYTDFSDAAAALAPFSKTREYMCLHGESVMEGLADLGTSSSFYRTRSSDSDFGFKGRMVCVNDFEFDLAYERVFSEVGSPWTKYCYILDLRSIRCYHLRGLKFRYMANIHNDPGGQIRKSQYEAHVGLGVTWPKRNAYIYGATGA